MVYFMANPALSPVILDYDTPAFTLHEPIIDELLRRAFKCKCIQEEARQKIFTEAGVVCAVPQDRDAESVSKRFFGYAIGVVRDEQEAAKHRTRLDEIVQQRRVLLQDVLAVHFSIMEMQSLRFQTENDIAYEGYQIGIEEVEAYCRDNQLPSILPNLFHPRSLANILRDQASYPKSPAVKGLHKKLVGLFLHQPKHLHAVINKESRDHSHAQVVELLDDVASDRGLPLEDILMENRMTCETFVIALFHLKRYSDVIRVAGKVPDFFRETPFLVEKYLRAIIIQRDLNALVQLLTDYADRVPLREELVETAAIDACVDLGWELYGLGRYDELNNMLKCISYRRQDNEELHTLLETLETGE